jgi:dihydrofolate synthase/folylpolyglutamate synthase
MKCEIDVKAFMEKAAGYGSVLGLSSITELLDKLQHPEDDLSVIHVAGTNGKGSTCCFLRNVLTVAGYTVGMYTSPAVFSYEERFTIDGEPIGGQELQQYLQRIARCCQEIEAAGHAHPTVFEIETALAFLYFKEQQCDFVLLEVGMGGATDATNVIKDSVVSVFASIGRDHMGFLGNTPEEIAGVKAGIIKEGGCAVSIWQDKEVARVLQERAKEKNAELIFCDRQAVRVVDKTHVSYRDFPEITLGMQGTYQIDNAVLALEVVAALRKRGVKITDEAIVKGMAMAHWPGRMECISQRYQFYLDGAHNLPAALRLKETLELCFTNKTITYIIGVLADKEHEKMLSVLLPLGHSVITVTPDNPRAYSGEALAEEVRLLGYEAEFAPDLSLAVKMALSQHTDMILALGSLSYLGQCKAAFGVLDNKGEDYV